MHGGWKRIVGGLRHIDVVVWVDAFSADFATHVFHGFVSNDFVYVHI